MALDHTRLSERGRANVSQIMPKIQAAVAEREAQRSSALTPPPTDLSTSENWLSRPETIPVLLDALRRSYKPQHLSYPAGFSGDPDLLDALAAFFNSHFNPSSPVLSSHLVVAPGAGACLDAIMFNICDPGDAVLVPAPYWNGFDFVLRARSGVDIMPVFTRSLESSMTLELVEAIFDAYNTSIIKPKALILTNPSNPMGQCYPLHVLKGMAKACHSLGMHLIVDEIYALTKVGDGYPFHSILSLDAEALEVDPEKIHVVWSTSKDFGQSGVRMGCIITKSANVKTGTTLATTTQVSSLTAVAVTGLLWSPQLPRIISTNAQRLSEAYTMIERFLKAHEIQYVPSYAGLSVFARLAPNANSPSDEQEMVATFKRHGVLVAAGSSFHPPGNEFGWARISFAVERESLETALGKMHKAMVPHSSLGVGRHVRESRL